MGAEGLCSSSARPSKSSQRSSTAMAQRSAADSMSLQLCSRSQSDTKWHTAP